MPWLTDDRTELAAQRILDAAGRLFADRGLSGPGMDEIARAAGCSRATVYRYFENRNALQTAFAQRELTEITTTTLLALEGTLDRDRRIVLGILGIVRELRARNHLHTWYVGSDVTLTAEIVDRSDVVRDLVAGALARESLPSDEELARWIIRIMHSLLVAPGLDDAEEEAMIRRFVLPIVYGA
jgi:AcrR family transcriptional regulator